MKILPMIVGELEEGSGQKEQYLKCVIASSRITGHTKVAVESG